MKTAIPFTTNLSSDLMQWLTHFSQETNSTKRSVLEQALQLFREETMRRKMAASFQQANKDVKIMKMTEEGMDDYFEQLQTFSS